MIVRTLIFIFLLGVSFFAYSKGSITRELPGGMQKLCAEAEKDYTPSLEAIRFPNKHPLFHGIELGSGYDETLKLLAGRNPDSILILDDVTPFHFAIGVGNWRAAKALLSAGANINQRRASTGSTALELAAVGSQFPEACKLIENNIELPKLEEERNQLVGSTLSMNLYDAEKGSVFLDYLFSIGFNVNDYGSPLETPLMSAVSLHNIPVIKVLLRHGARLDIVKQGGRTVWTVAREKNNPQVLKLLKEAQKKAKPQKRQPAALVPATV